MAFKVAREKTGASAVSSKASEGRLVGEVAWYVVVGVRELKETCRFVQATGDGMVTRGRESAGRTNGKKYALKQQKRV